MITSKTVGPLILTVFLFMLVGVIGFRHWLNWPRKPVDHSESEQVGTAARGEDGVEESWLVDGFEQAVTRIHAGMTRSELNSTLPAAAAPGLGHLSLCPGKAHELITFVFPSHWYCVYIEYPYDGPVGDSSFMWKGWDAATLDLVKVYRVEKPTDNYQAKVRVGGHSHGPSHDYIDDFFSVVTLGQPNDLGIHSELIHSDVPSGIEPGAALKAGVWPPRK